MRTSTWNPSAGKRIRSASSTMRRAVASAGIAAARAPAAGLAVSAAASVEAAREGDSNERVRHTPIASVKVARRDAPRVTRDDEVDPHIFGAEPLGHLERPDDCLRLALDDLQERLRCPGWRALSLLPLSQGRRADSKRAGKLILRKPQALAGSLNFIGFDGDLVHARAHLPALGVSQRLSHRFDQFVSQLAHLRFLVALMAAAKAATDFRCSAVRSARSFLPYTSNA